MELQTGFSNPAHAENAAAKCGQNMDPVTTICVNGQDFVTSDPLPHDAGRSPVTREAVSNDLPAGTLIVAFTNTTVSQVTDEQSIGVRRPMVLLGLVAVPVLAIPVLVRHALVHYAAAA